MPNYKGHLCGGLIVFGVALCCVWRVLNPSLLTVCEWLLFTLAGALFPDVDIKSKGQKYFYHLIFLFFIVLVLKERYQMLGCCSFIIITPMLVRHRGVFHSPRFVIAIPLLFWMCVAFMMPKIGYQFFFDTLFFIIGCLSHVWLDLGARHMFRRLFTRQKRK